MTLNEFKREYATKTESAEQESEMMFEPIIENNKMIGIVAKVFCPRCKEWELMQIYTDGMNQSLEEAVIDMGLRDESFDDDDDDEYEDNIEDDGLDEDEGEEDCTVPTSYEKAYRDYYRGLNKSSCNKRYLS